MQDLIANDIFIVVIRQKNMKDNLKPEAQIQNAFSSITLKAVLKVSIPTGERNSNRFLMLPLSCAL